jgi:excisionase family DNA binding protein
VIPLDQLREIITQAVCDAERKRTAAAQADSQGLTLAKAARLAGKRRETLAEAIRAGVLPAHRTGRKRWTLTAGNVRAWLESGAPVRRIASAAT